MHGIASRTLTLLLFTLLRIAVLQIILTVASLVGKTPKSACGLRVSFTQPETWNAKFGTVPAHIKERWHHEI
jgi:hypothetical protein